MIQKSGETEVDVLIVGAGPTGLTLAVELARAGLTYRLIDRNAGPAQHSQALVVQARTLEQFERYGIAERAVAAGRPLRGGRFVSGGRTVAHLALSGIPGRFPFVLFLPQSQTERLLIEYLASLNGVVERNVELAGFAERGDAIEAELRSADGRPERVRARYLAGCDGAHSAVRARLGVPFEGDSVALSFFLGDLALEGRDVPDDELCIYVDQGNLAFVGRLDERTSRLIVALHDEQQREAQQQPTLDDFRHALARCAPGADIRITGAEWMTPFRVNERKAGSYRAGRAFLAGDAAHIHSPAGGQGMNTGIQDVANLGWKLAAVVRDGADAALLDTYHDERSAVGDALIATTSRVLRTATSANPIVDAIRDAVVPIAASLPFVQERIARMVSETAITYRGSTGVRDAGGHGTLRAGDRAPDADLGGATLLAPLRAAQHLLLAVDVDDDQPLRALAPRAGFVPVRSAALAGEAAAYGRGTIYAIRPDGYIGFRGPVAAHDGLAAYARSAGLA